MKSRGKKLERSYDQIFDYWTHIVPHRPPYVILCNFDEFWIYDFNIQLFDPVEKISLADLPHRAEALAFLLGVYHVCACKKAAGEPLTLPGLTLPMEDNAEFVTEDCIKV